jgi:hypothetical protein
VPTRILPSWLHGYLASHKQPHPLPLEEIQRTADLTISRHDNLRRVVIHALKALVAAGFLVSWQVNGNHVAVVRSASLLFKGNNLTASLTAFSFRPKIEGCFPRLTFLPQAGESLREGGESETSPCTIAPLPL